MFTLTDAGRENLVAILGEFQRASGYYPPLYHERLTPWLSGDSAFMSDAQWQAFIGAESDDVGDSDWWEWAEPHSTGIGFSGTCLGRWFGHSDGMQEFINLVESATTVLQREDFSHVNDIEIPFSFHTFDEWVSTLHVWAFRFQMPLLRCDFKRWGAEDADQDQFNDLGEVWRRTGNGDYPVHPVCWTLIDNVFTSSATAIRTILRPDNVITTNDPWPTAIDSSVRTSVVRLGEQLDNASGQAHSKPKANSHRLLRGPLGWTFAPAGSSREVSTMHQAGLHRIAILIERANDEFAPKELAGHGGKSIRKHGKVVAESDLGEEHSLRRRNRISLKEYKDDKQGRQEVENDLREWMEARANAEAAENATEYEEAEEQIAHIKKQFNVTRDNTIKRQRPFRDRQEKNAKDTVSTTIKNAVADLKRQLPKLAVEFDQLLEQITFSEPTFKFKPNPAWTEWSVVRRV